MDTLLRAAFAAAVLAVTGCGGEPTATLKGRLVDGAQPVGTDGQQVGLSFHPITPEGTADPKVVHPAVLNADGTFAFVASGGTLPPGRYRVVIAASQGGPPNPKAKKSTAPNKFAPHATLAGSKLTVTVEPGANDVVIDLSKPGN